jgi:hypothetical protein
MESKRILLIITITGIIVGLTGFLWYNETMVGEDGGVNGNGGNSFPASDTWNPSSLIAEETPFFTIEDFSEWRFSYSQFGTETDPVEYLVEKDQDSIRVTCRDYNQYGFAPKFYLVSENFGGHQNIYPGDIFAIELRVTETAQGELLRELTPARSVVISLRVAFEGVSAGGINSQNIMPFTNSPIEGSTQSTSIMDEISISVGHNMMIGETVEILSVRIYRLS